MAFIYEQEILMLKLKRKFSFAVMLPVLVVLTGCASVADYTQPISDLNSSIDSSVTTVIKIDEELTSARNKKWIELVEKKQAFILSSDDGCSLGSKSCSLVLIESGSSLEHPFPAKSMMPKAIIALSELRRYTGNLKTIMDADTVASVITSANAALASAAKIETAITKENKITETSSIKAYTPPISASIRWLVSQYVDRQKVKALATATERAQPVIEELALYYETAAAASSSVKDGNALKKFLKSQERFDNASLKSDQVINQYLLAVGEYDTALKASSSKPMKKFLEAHSLLNISLNGTGEASLADAISAIKDFKEHSQDFKKIIDSYISVAELQQGNN